MEHPALVEADCSHQVALVEAVVAAAVMVAAADSAAAEVRLVLVGWEAMDSVAETVVEG